MMAALMPCLLVGAGGAIGAVLRYLTTVASLNLSLTLPLGTLISNLAGCFVIGVVVTLAGRSTLISTEARLFLATGICGGYTTLSSLVFELVELVREGHVFQASAYVAATLAGSVLTFFLGVVLARALTDS